MSASPSKSRNKVYTEVTATITYTAKNRSDAEYLMTNFLSRKGLIQQGDVEYSSKSVNKATRVKVRVTYKVHGGWRSDFIKKVESDARDAGIEIQDLDVTVGRREIPEECPRRDCVPCGLVVKGLSRYQPRQVVNDEKPDTLEDEVEVPAQPKLAPFKLPWRK